MASGGFNETLKWTFGLLNCANKYVTAEAFQSKVNANGTTLKKKQIWTLERVEESVIALKSHLGRYLTVDRNGKIDASGEEIGPDQKFEFFTQEDGKIAIRSATHERYIGGTGDMMTGFDKEIGETNLFTIHLAMHPQINLRNVNRKTYCHQVGEEIRCNEVIPWGYDAMIILEFHGGKYALRAANGQYLSRQGKLVNEPSADTLYTLVFRNAQVAFRDCKNKYLTAIGASATVQARKETIGKDELFALEDSHPQVRLIANNGRYCSVRDSEDVRAKPDDYTDAEIFQMEAVDRSDRSGNVKWAFRSNNKKFWNADASSVISNQDDFSAPTTHFEIEWEGPMICLKASNGKYVSIKANGQMIANAAEKTETCKFVFEFINRPILVLRGEFGFVGVKGATSGVLECNRSQYDLFEVTGNAGTYNIKGANGKYWKLQSDGTFTTTGDKGEDFFFELRAHTHMCIVARNGQYIKGVQNGGFTATGGTTINSSTLWEY